MSSLEEKLIQLRKAIHPEQPMDIITQCEIVTEALSFGSPYEEDVSGLAEYLGVSYNQVYKMNYITENMIPELKEWFHGTQYQCHTTYDRATLPVKAQWEFMKGMNILVTGSDSSSRTIITEEQK